MNDYDACRNFYESTRGCKNPTIIRQLNNVLALFLLNDDLQVAFSSLPKLLLIKPGSNY